MPVRHDDRTNTRPAGTGSIVVARGLERSVVTHAFAASPLKWLMPKSRGDAAWLFTSSYGGGLVDGDALDLSVRVERRAQAYLSTQSATKVYRSIHGTRTSIQATIGEAATLVYVPDPVVCFAEGRYEQVQTVDLCSQSTFAMLDWITSGRLAYGERWAFRDYHARTTIRRDGRLLLHDSVRLRQDDGELAARMGRVDVLATLVIIGDTLAPHVRQIQARVAGHAPQRQASLLMSAAPIGDEGCVVKVAGVDLEEVRHTVRGLLDFVPCLLGDDPWARKW